MKYRVLHNNNIIQYFLYNFIKLYKNKEYDIVSRMLRRSLSTYAKLPVSALNVFQKSCYYKIDFKINENASVKEAVTRFTAFNIGC